jgi:hypothetical protein
MKIFSLKTTEFASAWGHSRGWCAPAREINLGVWCAPPFNARTHMRGAHHTKIKECVTRVGTPSNIIGVRTGAKIKYFTVEITGSVRNNGYYEYAIYVCCHHSTTSTSTTSRSFVSTSIFNSWMYLACSRLVFLFGGVQFFCFSPM